MNAVTRSGTNKWHGTGFEFVRNGVLNATTQTYAPAAAVGSNPTAPAGVRDTLTHNQFGGTLGGPIKRDKIFFFAGYQGTLASSTVGQAQSIVPTTNMRNGDFSACASSPIKAPFTTTTNPLVSNNVLQPALLQTPSALLAAKILALIPYSGTDPCGSIFYEGPSTITKEHQGVGRLDWQRTWKDTIFAHYFFTHYAQPNQFSGGSLLSVNSVGLSDLVQTFVFGDTHILGSHGLNTLGSPYDRTASVRTSATGIPDICFLGMNATCPLKNFINAWPGAAATPKPGFLGYDFENSFGGTEAISWTLGRHQLDAGFTFIHVQMNNDGLFQVDPNPTFNGNTTGYTMADFITGNADGFTQGNGQLGREGQNQPSLYL